MATHDVSFSIPERRLGRADVQFLVREDQVLFGTLAVSNGSLVWFPKGTIYGYKLGWSKLDALMQEHATRFERR